MISKTMMKKRKSRKTNPIVANALQEALKHEAWNGVAQRLSSSTRNYDSVNLFQLDKETQNGDTVIIIGKILSQGELSKKVKLSALAISKSAREKLKASKSEFIPLTEEIRKNPKAEGVKIWK